LAECGLARRKIENERNSVLKNLGYNLEHNFGQGSSRAADAFFLLNLSALQFHTILGYCGLWETGTPKRRKTNALNRCWSL
jgi:hypothetical protein